MERRAGYFRLRALRAGSKPALHLSMGSERPSFTGWLLPPYPYVFVSRGNIGVSGEKAAERRRLV